MRTRTILLLSLAMLCSPARAADAEVWRQRLTIDAGLPLLEVWIGRSGPWRFALDTGAEGSTVSRTLAERLALPVLGAVEQYTLAGSTKTLLVRVSGLRVGRDGPVTNVDAAVSDLVAMRRVVRDVDGVLGGDALAGFDYLLDYGRGRLTLGRDGAGLVDDARGGAELPMQMDRHRPIVSWPADRGEAPVPLVLDTGASALIVDRREASRFDCRGNTSGRVMLETHTAAREASSCEVAVLRAGSVSVRGVQLVTVVWPDAIARRDRGLLPASAFDRVYVSPRRGALRVWAR